MIRNIPSLKQLAGDAFFAYEWHDRLSDDERWSLIETLDQHNVAMHKFPDIILFFEQLLTDELQKTLKPSSVRSLVSVATERMWRSGRNALDELLYRLHHSESGTLMMELYNKERKILNIDPLSIKFRKSEFVEYVAAHDACIFRSSLGNRCVLVETRNVWSILEDATLIATKKRQFLCLQMFQESMSDHQRSSCQFCSIRYFKWIP